MTDELTITSGLKFAQMEGSFYFCDKTRYISSRCPANSKPKSEWAANKMKEVLHAEQILNQATAAQSQHISHCLYNSATNGALICHQVTVIPMNATVIEMVKQLVKAEGMNWLVLHGKNVL